MEILTVIRIYSIIICPLSLGIMILSVILFFTSGYVNYLYPFYIFSILFGITFFVSSLYKPDTITTVLIAINIQKSKRKESNDYVWHFSKWRRYNHN